MAASHPMLSSDTLCGLPDPEGSGRFGGGEGWGVGLGKRGTPPLLGRVYLGGAVDVDGVLQADVLSAEDLAVPLERPQLEEACRRQQLHGT